MRSKPIIGEEKIRKTLRLYPEDWEGRKKRFGLFGGRRRYTFQRTFQTGLMWKESV